MATAAAIPTILLVDDDSTTRFLTRRLLTRLAVQAQLLEAENGQQALALVEAHCQAGAPPQSLLVLLDLNMPTMNGLEFLEHQVRLPSICQQVTTVIVVSDSPNPEERARAHALAVEVRHKPLTDQQLTELVHRHLPAALPGR